MKRLLALLLVLAAILCAGCSEEPEPTAEVSQDQSIETSDTQNTTEESTTEAPTTQAPTEETEPPTMANEYFDPVASAQLIDTWSVDVVLDGSIMNFPDMESSITMKLQYQLNGDGTYIRGVEQEEYDTAIAAYESFINTYMLAQRYATFVAEQKLMSKDEEEISQAWNQSGWPKAQAEVDEFVEKLYLGYRFSFLNRSGDYYAQDGVLYLSQEDGTYEACTYELTEEGLTLLDSTDPAPFTQVKLEFPLLLTNGTVTEEPTTEETTPEDTTAE